MEKLVVGPPSRGKVSLDNTVRENLEIIADSKQRQVRDLNIVILERERHRDLIAQVRDTGARIKLISDGDLSAGLATSISGAGIDAVFGTGGAPEGVLTAAAMKCLGGEILGRFVWKDEAEKKRAKEMGIQNLDRTYTTDELVPGQDVLFVATAVTDGEFFKGVRYLGNANRTETLLLAYRSRLVRFIHSHHILATQNWGVPLI
jgi:fructose-1,6-bisphosphatase II